MKSLTKLKNGKSIVEVIIHTGQHYDVSNLTIIDPVGYLNMVWLIEHCSLVMTDSGGLQKEAFFFAKPCITMRDETEWVETLEYGINNLFSPSNELKVEEVITSINHAPSEWPKLYGDGNASGKAVKHILEHN